MPKLIIDGQQVEVPEGTSVLEAAKTIGVTIPHFCYHPALGPVGACRLCSMFFIDGPVKGLQMSCMVKAVDGMVVSTSHGDAARLRSRVIEWLMENHPHDCPVCDEGGSCLLQDYTIAGGHSIRRYKGKKRTYTSQYLGEFIYQEMNRCIQCYRCSRFYQDYCGGVDFGPLQISNKVFFGRYKDGWLDSPFHGNLAEVCPTGVFTDKTYRFKARPWDLETAPSVCPHCSLGCNTTPGARYRKLLRITARENQAVNGWFICDRGRFGYGFAGRADRPYFPSVDGVKSTHSAAAKAAAHLISQSIEGFGPDSVSFIGSARASVESNFALRRLARYIGADRVCYSADPGKERRDRRAVSNLRPGFARSLGDIAHSDYIIAAGADPINEAPMLALMMRQASRKGAFVRIIDPRPVELPLKFIHDPIHPDGLADALTTALADIPATAKKITIIVGTGVADYKLIDRAAAETARLRDISTDCGLMYILSAANSFGTATLAADGGDFEDVLAGIEEGQVKTLVVMASDPVGMYPDSARIAAAFKSLKSLIVMDYLPSKTVSRADVFLPLPIYAEENGMFINNEGLAQAFAQAYVGGMPINDMGPDVHPPREFSSSVPGYSKPAWEWAQEVAELIRPGYDFYGSVDDIREGIAAEFPSWAALTGISPLGCGLPILPGGGYEPPDILRQTAQDGDLLFHAVDTTFGTEELSFYSEHTQARAAEPYVIMNSRDASVLGLTEGMCVDVTNGACSLSSVLKVSENSAAGVVSAPNTPGTPAAVLSGTRVSIKAAD